MNSAKLAPSPIRIVLVHSHRIILEGLRMLVNSCSNSTVVGVASSSAEAIKVVVSEQPDIVLVDLDTDTDRGIDLLSELSNACPEARLVALTHARRLELHQQAISLGAVGFVNDETSSDQLTRAFERVHAGEIWLDRAVMSRMIKKKTQKEADQPEAFKIGSLTNREREVVMLMGEGLKSRQIASRLFISETTVRHHLTTIFSKLGVCDRFELLIYAYKNGLAIAPGSQPHSLPLGR